MAKGRNWFNSSALFVSHDGIASADLCCNSIFYVAIFPHMSYHKNVTVIKGLGVVPDSLKGQGQYHW